MKTKIANLKRPDILGNDDRSSDQEIFNATLKQWRQKLGYYSIIAAVPAILASHIPVANSQEVKKPEASVAGRGVRLLERLKMNFSSNPALLKRQSEYRLPHQKGSFDIQAALAGNDDCPGRTIPGGNYTAASPYTESGDTTGANDTVSLVNGFYYYYSYDARGPDQVYSFTLTGRGPNPQIEVSTPSGTYRPLIYVFQDGSIGTCPAGTGNSIFAPIINDSRWSHYSTATLGSNQMNFLPLNVPLHLFIDSARDDANGSGPYTIRMQDVTIAPAAVCTNSNPIDCTDFFLRQHYLDFLGREPDLPGFAGWQNILNNCGITVNQPCDRIEVSSDFLRSPEFQGRGYFIFRFYIAGLGRNAFFKEFMPDLQRVSGFQDDAQLEASKVAFVNDFVSRPEFKQKYDSITDPAAYVDAILSTAGVSLSQRQQLIDDLAAGRNTRAGTLRAIMESQEVYNKYYNTAFVVMQYFGYLRRDPDILYLEWIKTMDMTGDYRTMTNGFMNSIEYRSRFSLP